MHKFLKMVVNIWFPMFASLLWDYLRGNTNLDFQINVFLWKATKPNNFIFVLVITVTLVNT